MAQINTQIQTVSSSECPNTNRITPILLPPFLQKRHAHVPQGVRRFHVPPRSLRAGGSDCLRRGCAFDCGGPEFATQNRFRVRLTVFLNKSSAPERPQNRALLCGRFCDEFPAARRTGQASTTAQHVRTH